MLCSSFPWLTSLIFLPMAGAFLLALLQSRKVCRKNISYVAVATSGVTFLYAVILFFGGDFSSGSFQFMENRVWIPSLRIDYSIGVDGVAILFVLLSTFLSFLALCASINKVTRWLEAYCISFLVLETFILGTFCAMDLFLFYIFFEGVLVPMFFIIGIWGGKNRIYANWKFFLYTLFGSLMMLIGIIYLYLIFGTSSIQQLYEQRIALDKQWWLWLAFFFSFAIKLPIFPFHTWLPDAHVEAPMAGSILLAGILLKMGGYGFFRISIPIFPEASLYFSTLVFILSCFSVIYASMVAFVQKDIKKLIAYSSVAHMGFASAGLFTFTTYGVQGALFQMISHGLISAAIFMGIGFLYDRMQTREIDAYGGVAKVVPVFSVLMMIFILGSIGFPGTSGFVGEFLVLLGAYKISIFLSFVLGVGIILSAAYGLLFYRKIFLGTVGGNCRSLKSFTYTEKVLLITIAFFVVGIGIFPQKVLDLTAPSVERILDKVTRKTIKGF